MNIFFKTTTLFILNLILITHISFADDEFDLEEINEFSIFETSSNTSYEPITNSKNIVVLERNSSSILYEKNAFTKTPIASTTKIMTAILAIENSNLDDILIISKNASSINGSKLGLSYNSKITLKNCLYGLMLRSGNDCAIAIAEHISGSCEKFAILMNNKAKELGLNNTNFTSPHGLDNINHYSSAYDLAILTNYALKNSTFKEIVGTKTTNIIFNNKQTLISNTNELLGNISGVYGVKTGFTANAGRCLVSACKRDNLDIIIVVIGANTKKERSLDSTKLINYIFENYTIIDIRSTINDNFAKFENYFNNNVILYKTNTPPIIKLEKISNTLFPISSKEPPKFKNKIFFTKILSPNQNINSEIGKFEIYNNNNLLISAKILLKNKLVKNSIYYYFENSFKHLFHDSFNKTRLY